MKIAQLARDDERLVRRFENDDGSTIVIDFGGDSVDASAEVVDGTVLVVAGDEQYELEVPAQASDAQAFMKNGVLTIDLEASQ
ncbi:DUF7127 family protein [Natronosalvus caseinilyticus]|uniref:DUF7127 family protein n=1 Tax=Natronosalvus caseinilyticus TaxID=2953747 RepID=UPI0028AF0002|nr:Hsp20/alpha crystallin family protein [Natronosalvus caseinilyticus]